MQRDNIKQQRKLYRKNGRRAVGEKYNWETEGKKLLALYEGIIR